MKIRVITVFLIGILCLPGVSVRGAEIPALLQKDTLVAWCVAHYWDAAKRSPEERAQMLASLGLKRLAYNWREQDDPDFEAEILACQKSGIELFAFWNESEEAFKLFEQYGLHPQIWKICPTPWKPTTQEEKVRAAANRLQPFAERAQRLGSKFGIYNHGSWGGHPHNMVAVCEELRGRGFDNVGLVYNFHHAHPHLDDFKELFEAMLPYLHCLNLNGMAEPEDVNPETHENKILPLGSGVHEAAMIQIVLESGYSGPVAILGHLPTQDAEKSLRDNLEGLERLFAVE